MYRIFIVEDDSTMAAVMKKQIESWGHSVHVATQFSDILSEFTAYDPHMVLMDVMLEMYMQGQTLLAVLHDSERVSRHFPQTLRLDADIPQWKTERVRAA